MMVGGYEDPAKCDSPVCLSEMLANEDLFRILEGRQFLLCTDILVDGVTDKQSLQLHGKIPVTVRRAVRADGKRIKEMRIKGTLKRKSHKAKEVNELEAQNLTSLRLSPAMGSLSQQNESGTKLRATPSYHGGTASKNALNAVSSVQEADKTNKTLTRKISSDCPRAKNSKPNPKKRNVDITEIDQINQSEDVNLLVRNDHNTRINFASSMTTANSENFGEPTESDIGKTKSKRSKFPVTTITVTRSHTRFIKYDDGLECKEKVGSESVTLRVPKGLYYIDPSGPGNPSPGKGARVPEYDDCRASSSALGSEVKAPTSEISFVQNTLQPDDSTIFDVKARTQKNNPLINSIRWLYQNVAGVDNDDEQAPD